MKTPLDIEAIAQRLSSSGFHFGLSRTRNPDGIWECKIWPWGEVAESILEDREWPHGRANDYQEAIRKAIACLPKELEELFA